MRESSVTWEKYLRNQPLFDKDKILLLPEHINLGLMNTSLKI